VAQARDYREGFARFAVRAGLLRFGRFTTKSGRASPYFFNTGACADGAALSELGGYYAAAIADRFPDATVLFGPAYKGITLAAAAAMALSRGRTQPVGFCFDRKEHGEGGLLVGQLPTAAIATISQIVDVLSQQPVDGRALIDAEVRERIQAYLQRYAPR
jgi:orotate phosphoribosyltransferase